MFGKNPQITFKNSLMLLVKTGIASSAFEKNKNTEDSAWNLFKDIKNKCLPSATLCHDSLSTFTIPVEALRPRFDSCVLEL
jgi:hypothetical protein